MIVIEKLDHIQFCIGVGAEDEAHQFYTEILGRFGYNKPHLFAKLHVYQLPIGNFAPAIIRHILRNKTA